MKNINKKTNTKTQNHSQSVFDDPEKFVEKFEGRERDKWQKPDQVIKSFDLSDDDVLVEIGSGTGYFAIRLAQQLKNGKVIAFDQSSGMTSYLKNRIHQLGLTNIYAYQSDADGSIGLEEKADLIFLVDVYHHLKNRVSYFSNLASHLKQKGKLVIIDRTEEKVEGQPSGHRVSPAVVKQEMKEAGFQLIEELDFLLPIQYYLSFKLKR